MMLLLLYGGDVYKQDVKEVIRGAYDKLDEGAGFQLVKELVKDLLAVLCRLAPALSAMQTTFRWNSLWILRVGVFTCILTALLIRRSAVPRQRDHNADGFHRRPGTGKPELTITLTF
ncbi:hypothetical protein Baya_15200 [Bagarius yarrelli]|uniref:Uncharacterized protein n=1 Tax=Bagarius yarrelli TaxID=175774 RepID=A0A556VBF7_BAGYA|nr:hypothetical protein Baya_15200 [Bagarius yarrelli]